MRRASTSVARLRGNASGTALIEFAIGLPAFLTAVLGGLEVANFVLTEQRVTEMASQVASNAARGVSQIDETDVYQILTGAQLAEDTTPILENGRLILSSVRLNPAGNGQWIEWQRCTGSDTTITSAYGDQGKGKSDKSLQGIGGTTGLKAGSNVDIMLVEVQTKYRPLLGSAYQSLVGDRPLTAVAAHVVRDRTTFGIKNDGGLTGSKLKTC